MLWVHPVGLQGGVIEFYDIIFSHGLPFLFRLRFSFSGFSFLRIQVLSFQGSVCFWIHVLASEVLVFIKLACSIFSRFIAKWYLFSYVCLFFLWFKVTEVYGRNIKWCSICTTGNVVNRTWNFIIKVTYAVSKLLYSLGLLWRFCFSGFCIQFALKDQFILISLISDLETSFVKPIVLHFLFYPSIFLSLISNFFSNFMCFYYLFLVF